MVALLKQTIRNLDVRLIGESSTINEFTHCALSNVPNEDSHLIITVFGVSGLAVHIRSRVG